MGTRGGPKTFFPGPKLIRPGPKRIHPTALPGRNGPKLDRGSGESDGFGPKINRNGPISWQRADARDFQHDRDEL